jgi:hypothetical protein
VAIKTVASLVGASLGFLLFKLVSMEFLFHDYLNLRGGVRIQRIWTSQELLPYVDRFLELNKILGVTSTEKLNLVRDVASVGDLNEKLLQFMEVKLAPASRLAELLGYVGNFIVANPALVIGTLATISAAIGAWIWWNTDNKINEVFEVTSASVDANQVNLEAIKALQVNQLDLTVAVTKLHEQSKYIMEALGPIVTTVAPIADLQLDPSFWKYFSEYFDKALDKEILSVKNQFPGGFRPPSEAFPGVGTRLGGYWDNLKKD